MSGATAARAGDTAVAATAIVQAGKNCWRVDPADRFHCVQDGADYFRWVREALLGARNSVFILGWDILAAVDLLPNAGASEAPTRLDKLLAYVARRRPGLRCYILIWDYAALYTLERDPLSRWRLGWQMPRRVRFGFDDRHPVGGSHHQKIIVVDDRLAFCGGIDLTGHRWDTSAHRVHEPARVSPLGGNPYGPYHEVQAMVSGPVAASLGVLARDRWRALGEERLPAISPSHEDLWPSDLTPDLTDVEVAIARTVPGSEKQPPIRECESLFLDSIAAGRQTIYVESQYFTNDRLSEALAARLREPDGPEVIVVVPKDCDGWLERNTMGAFRDEVFRLMIDADRHKRLRLVYPIASRAENVPTFVHSKVMVVDDAVVRIGSANFSRRSMAVDTECDLAVGAAGDARVRSGIRQIRDRLLAEHLGLPVEAVAREIERAGSVRALIDQRQHFEHTLAPIEVGVESETAQAALQAVADPDEPIGFGGAVAELLPAADATYRHSPLRLRIVPAVVLAVAVASAWSAWSGRPEFQALRDALIALPTMPSMLWIGVAAFLLTNLFMIPLELLAFAAGVLFGATRGGLVSILGSLGAAALGYAAGRAVGPSGITRWISGRAYRSARQLGARGVMGVLVLRLASVASAGSIHLLCGAGQVPFGIYIAGTAIGLVPAVAALSGLGALVRHAVLYASLSNGLVAIGAAVLLTALAAGLRTFLLIRQFAPSLSNQRRRAEFG
jgi:phospholipase D1/2